MSDKKSNNGGNYNLRKLKKIFTIQTLTPKFSPIKKS